MLRGDVYYRKDNGRKVSGVILVLGYLGFEFWIVLFLYEEGSFIFIFLFVLFYCLKFLVYLEVNEEELVECIFWEERN